MHLRRSRWLLPILFLTAVSLSAAAQTSRTSSPKRAPSATPNASPAEPKATVSVDWDTLKPANEDFSILMPKDASTEITQFDYHKLELNARLYLSAPTSGPVVAVASMSGIKSNPAAYTDLARFNSYADAFKTFLPPKVRKDAITKMILTGSKPFHGYIGRVYKLTVGDLTGTVNAYVTKKRFYAIAILNTKKDDALEEKFLSSFVIPDKPIEQPVVTAEEGQEASAISQSPQRQRADGRKQQVDAEGNTTPNSSQDENQEPVTGTVATPNSPGVKPPKAPISGGMLNGKAIYLPLPEVPTGQPNGVVMVQILIDEQGTVIDAKAVSGPAGLHTAAMNAARLARFMPTVLAGEPVKVSGTLAYSFARAN